MQRSLLAKFKPTLFILGLLFSLTTLFFLFLVAFGSGMARLGGGYFELLALPIKWLIATFIFHWMLGNQDPQPQFDTFGASFAKIYGKLTIIQMVVIVVLGVLSLSGDWVKPFLIGVPVLSQIMMPFLAARSISEEVAPK